MNNNTIVLGLAALSGVALVIFSRKPNVSPASDNRRVGLNTGVYNPIFNPGGSTNYTNSFTAGSFPTGISNQQIDDALRYT